MTAEVIAYSATESDTSLSLKVECLDCRYEWGWSADTKGTSRWLQQLADFHNAEHHKSRQQ
jgi:hypothetical protein